MVCDKCGTQINATDTKCPKCGNAVSAPTAVQHSAVYPSLSNYCALAKRSFILAFVCWALFAGFIALGIPTLISIAGGKESFIIFVWFAVFVACLAVSAVNLVTIKNLYGSYFVLTLPNEIEEHEVAGKKLKLATILTLIPAAVAYLTLIIIMGVIFIPGLKV